MSRLKKGKVKIEVCRSQSGGFSLCIGDDDSGHRLVGGKVGGMETVLTFIVDAKELIEQAVVYGEVNS